MSRMLFDVIERKQRSSTHVSAAIRFIVWTILFAALVFWSALIIMV